MLTACTRRNFLRSGTAVTAATLIPGTAWTRPESGIQSESWARADVILRQLQPFSFPPRTFAITDFGAIGDATTKNTSAINRSIAACSTAGGGRVVIGKGRFLTGAIRLKSNVELHLEDEAVVLFSTDPADYPVVHTRWEGVYLMGYSPQIYAFREKNIAITGNGLLDGQASDRHWWSWKGPGWRGSVIHGWREGMPHQRAARTALFQMAEDNVPVEKRIFAAGAYLRPPMIGLYGCENVRIESIAMKRFAFWHIHPGLFTDVIVRGVQMMSHGPNTDGCNPESTQRMLIENCLFDTGDDCIAVDSGRNAEGRRVGVPSQDIVIRNCRMIEGHGGIVIGSVISGGVNNVFAENCDIGSPNLLSAIRFKNNAMRRKRLENFYYRNIRVSEVSHAAIECDFNYEEGPNGPYIPILRNVSIENLTVERSPMIADLQGLPISHIRDLTIANSDFAGVTKESIVSNVDGLVLRNVTANGRMILTL